MRRQCALTSASASSWKAHYAHSPIEMVFTTTCTSWACYAASGKHSITNPRLRIYHLSQNRNEVAGRVSSVAEAVLGGRWKVAITRIVAHRTEHRIIAKPTGVVAKLAGDISHASAAAVLGGLRFGSGDCHRRDEAGGAFLVGNILHFGQQLHATIPICGSAVSRGINAGASAERVHSQIAV